MSDPYGRMAGVNDYHRPPNHPYAPQHSQHSQHAQQAVLHPHPHPVPVTAPGRNTHAHARSVPEEIGEVRRALAAAVDGVITVVAGFGLALQLAEGRSVGTFWAYAVACVLGVSFVHHVSGTWILRATVGKFLLVTRVVRDTDAGRPRFWQLVRRWLMGLTWIPMQPVRSLIAADGDPYEDHCGLRYVRSRDLR